jgi:hypothetical protein
VAEGGGLLNRRSYRRPKIAEMPMDCGFPRWLQVVKTPRVVKTGGNFGPCDISSARMLS